MNVLGRMPLMAAVTDSPTGVSPICTVLISIMSVYTDADLIYKAGKRAIAGAPWKYSSQLFEMNQLVETAHLQKAMLNKRYDPDNGNKFMINERGKHRLVTSIPCPDKTVNHVLCDEVLTPYLEPYLIHDNSASRVGRGVSFFRRRFEQHIHEFYRRYGNAGYILLGDFKSYYASISAVKAKEMILDLASRRLSENDLRDTEWLLDIILGDGTGINIGGQPSQDIGIAFAHAVDDYVKTVKSQRYYARYTDDFYCMHPSKDYLLKLLDGIRTEAAKCSLTIHPYKTHIARLDQPFRILQISYRLTDSGKLVKRIAPKSIKRQRDRMKAYRRLLEKGRMSYEDVENAYKSWICNNYKVMSFEQIKSVNKLYYELFERSISWKNSRLRYLMGRS